MGLAIAPPRPVAGELAQQRPQRGVVLGDRDGVALGGAVLARQSACPTLREPEPFLQGQDGTAPPGRAQKFPEASSFRP